MTTDPLLWLVIFDITVMLWLCYRSTKRRHHYGKSGPLIDDVMSKYLRP